MEIETKNSRIRDTRVSLFDDNRGFLDVEPKKFHERVYEPRESFEVRRRRAQRYEEINVRVLESCASAWISYWIFSPAHKNPLL